MGDENYSKNERIRRFVSIVCGFILASCILSLLGYWVYIEWNKVEPKRECITKNLDKCFNLFGQISSGSEFNNCSWFENKEIVWCESVYGDDQKWTKYGYCQSNCSSKVTGYDQLSVIHDGNLSSCSHKNSIKVFIKTDTIKCKEMCDNREECNYFYSNDSEYCVIYKSCEKSRRITTLGATPGRTYIKQIYYFS